MDSFENVGSEELDKLVQYIDDEGGVESQRFSEIARKFNYTPTFKVDQSLDPFSNEYSDQMLQLYEELSGQTLDQDVGEITPLDVAHHVAGVNPYASENIAFISKHARAVLTSIMVANPPTNARVLDLGCGWGLSTEMIGFTGAKVTAVDINPDFVELVAKRAERHGRSPPLFLTSMN